MKSDHKMTLEQIQRRVDEYISQFREGYFSPLALMARMSEEVGELAREVNHKYGEKPKKTGEPPNTIDNELADILFIIVCFANSLNIDLDAAFKQVMDKFETRDKDRWTRIEDTPTERTELKEETQ